MHSYHDGMKRLPVGAQNNPRTAWPVYLYSQIEMGASATAYRYDRDYNLSPNTVSSTLTGVVCAYTPIFFCPSDRSPPLYWQGDIYWRTKGSYAVNWGGTADPGSAPAGGPAPFGYTDYSNRASPRLVRLNDIKDGTSSTLMLSEVIPAGGGDIRGDFISDDRGCGKFMTLDTPNSGTDTSIYVCDTSDPTLPACTASQPAARMAARSRHPGGVNATMCDGAVRFVKDSIDLASWQALGTMRGRDIPTEN
jgi:prepilin-type processing-associated H-X9-DG protein